MNLTEPLPVEKQISKNEIAEIQKEWGVRITQIGTAWLEKMDVQHLAELLVNDLYGYSEGRVLFKPTKVEAIPFRFTFEGAVSYFVGGNSRYPEDKGFALHPWKKVRFENKGIILEKTHALVMGHYYFTDQKNKEYKAEYSLGYFRTSSGALKINLHHSSFPFCYE